MAQAVQSKNVKPKVEEAKDAPDTKAVDNTEAEDGSTLTMMQVIILSVVMLVCSAATSVVAAYFIAPMAIKPVLEQLQPSDEEGHGEEGHGEHAEAPHIGPVLDLEEFTVNLKDPEGDRYLRIDLSFMVTSDDPEFLASIGIGHHEPEESGGGGHGGGDEGGGFEDRFHTEMAHYVPAIRDSVISSLTKRSAAELSTPEGKLHVKEEMQREVDGIFHGSHKVIRVNFENFIIQ